MDDLALRLLQLLHGSADGVSLARAAKRLDVEHSRLRRLLAVLGEDARFGGLGLVRQHDDGERIQLSLTGRGQSLIENGLMP
ncbi:MAG: hypothetical protein DI635_01000 [Pseudoxanthomonas suwonensis]|nr:MAG: hypothetical protein DI635_01000 [Pseudoxanthomonas suwonensis]